MHPWFGWLLFQQLSVSHWLAHRCSEGGAESGFWDGLKHLAPSASNSTTRWDLPPLLCFHFAFVVTRTALF